MDLNGDGHLDLISGSWPGEIFYFRGGPGRTFAAPEMLKDKDGEFINIGGGTEKLPDGMLLIRGHGEFEETDEGTFVTYRGKRYESTPETPIGLTGTASAVHAADWDSDGDYDLLVGEIRGSVYLIPNEGTPREYAFAKEQQLEADGRPIRVAGDAGPFVADWDGDGKPDLLVGSGDGSVSLFRNVGTAQQPELAAAVELVPAGDTAYGTDAPEDPVRGTRSKVCAADWNGDGHLDLLVGDVATQKPDRPEATPEQETEYEKLREELESVQERYRELVSRTRGESRERDADKRREYRAEMTNLVDRIVELHDKLPREYDMHGWVWLFLREPAEPQDEEHSQR